MPISRQYVSVDVAAHTGAVGEQLGEHFALNRQLSPARNLLDDLTGEHVASCVDLVGGWILRLLQERGYPAISIGRHATEGPGIAHPHKMHRYVGVVRAMTGEQLA